MKQQPVVSSESLVERLFQFTDHRHSNQYEKFFCEMLEGVLGSQSALISNVARFLDEPLGLASTAHRLSRLLRSRSIEWEDLQKRATELASQLVRDDDVIAFDPGDLIKNYAEKMEGLYRVHDGSRDECGNGYEDFSVEAIQWRNGKRLHVPLYQKITNAGREDYISQNHQITEAIYAIRDYTGDKGTWVFDRAHDRSMLYKKAFFVNPQMRWIVRAKENRLVFPLNPFYELPGGHALLMDMAKEIPLTEAGMRLTFPSVTAPIHLGWERVRLVVDGSLEKEIMVVVAHDRRNKDPVIMLTNLMVTSADDALMVFGYYLERWRKEEGYRFTKSFLNIEEIRVMRFKAIENLAFIVHLVYFWVTLFHRSNPELIENLTEEKLKHERPIEVIDYRYYRVAQLMRLLLAEQKGRMHTSFLMTQVA